MSRKGRIEHRNLSHHRKDKILRLPDRIIVPGGQSEKGPHHDPLKVPETPGKRQSPEGAVHGIEGLVHILDEQDGPGKIRHEGR